MQEVIEMAKEITGQKNSVKYAPRRLGESPELIGSNEKSQRIPILSLSTNPRCSPATSAVCLLDRNIISVQIRANSFYQCFLKTVGNWHREVNAR